MKVQIIACLAIVACCNASPEALWKLMLDPSNLQAPTEKIPALAESLGLSTLVTFVKRAGLADALSGAGPFTVFGPNNAAFAKLPPALVQELLKNNTLLAEVLEYHVLGGAVYSSALSNELLAATLLPNEKIRINLYNNNQIATASGRRIVAVDQNATNGVIHTLDSVMLPPVGTVTGLVQAMAAFSTLLKAVSVAGLADTLNGPGPFTVFAPTNEAFSKLPPGTLQKLLSDPKALANVLLYHVVNGTVYSAGLMDGESVPTLNKNDVKISISQGGVKVNNANVIMPDVSVTNGAIHVIDTVLIPPSDYENKMYFIQNLKSSTRL
ncbi:transforming growth factor-beta-induced protein ig-h3 [Patella vulgata]|uniref:transforming growth factor-beta-induced protein ig-h3 n=1 Tax=Patella vulgata TaxID=6465 RepID=UPI0021801590|nr:transforming growth factor-beta-induced protein ig-h3 [Patella vulgata]